MAADRGLERRRGEYASCPLPHPRQSIHRPTQHRTLEDLTPSTLSFWGKENRGRKGEVRERALSYLPLSSPATQLWRNLVSVCNHNEA